MGGNGETKGGCDTALRVVVVGEGNITEVMLPSCCLRRVFGNFKGAHLVSRLNSKRGKSNRPIVIMEPLYVNLYVGEHMLHENRTNGNSYLGNTYT